MLVFNLTETKLMVPCAQCTNCCYHLYKEQTFKETRLISHVWRTRICVSWEIQRINYRRLIKCLICHLVLEVKLKLARSSISST